MSLWKLLFGRSKSPGQTGYGNRLEGDSTDTMLGRSKSSGQTYGLSLDNPILCGGGPAGEQDYLDRLRCPSGALVRYARRGSTSTTNVGFLARPGVYFDAGPSVSKKREATYAHEVAVDIYFVECECGKHRAEVFMDMYHKGPAEPIGEAGWILQGVDIKTDGSGIRKSFDGTSQELKQTQVVLTLDTPLISEKNAVWCASFLAAWKALQHDVVGEPVQVAGAVDLCKRLNEAVDPREQVPSGCLYATAGWSQKGIVQIIEQDIRRLFPTKEPPTFPGIAENSFVAYGYLEANIRFRIRYFQNREPLVFMDSKGAKIKVNSFGVRREDDYAYFALREQPAILFEAINEHHQLECAIDLDRTSEPSQIVLALVERKRTLAETLASIEEKIVSPGGQEPDNGLGPNDVLLVPDFFWHITHRLAELEEQTFMNPTLKGQRMDVAQQDILFRLDRSGAKVASEAKEFCLPAPTYFVFDRPFLIYMKKRGESHPYFVIWVDNAELLQKME